MPSELDPAFDNYMPPRRRETPTEGMKRIELEMRDRPDLNPGRIATGAGRTREGYNASIGAQGPVGGGVMVAADPITGQPVMVGGRAQAGPLSYQYNQPAFKGAPASQQVGVGAQPFDADAYFGVTAQQGPGGRSYGANVSQSGEDGGWSAYGQYNPSRRDVNVGGSYTANFATGGRAVVGHATAAGEPVSLETRKGEIRHRQDSGASRMAADYGYIDTSKPDHDGMKTDAFVGPHRDSKKVFVVNQQHPHTGKFNEHKVLLGYKDRAHALRDYAHSFSDGLGHKRIHSVVEMGTHELKDWLKKPHTEPLKKAEGGPVDEPRPLTIRRGVTPQGLAAEMIPPEEQSSIEGRQAASPSPEGVTSALQGVAEGVSSLYATPQADAAYTTAPPAPVRRPITPQMIAASLNPEAQGAASPSLEGLGQGMVSMGEDPVGLIGGMLPGIGNVMAAADVSKLKDKIAELRASGDEEGATRLQKILPLAAMGAVMPMGAGAATKAAIKGAEKGAAREIADVAESAAKQAISSADTSIKQIPAIFKSKSFEAEAGARNLDIGGGKYDLGTDYLKNERGVESSVYDPFNRSPEHNAAVLDEFKQNPADTVTAANVLNVIAEPEARAEVIQQAFDHLKPGGKAYFDVYEGSRSGEGAATSKGWQNNMKAQAFLEEVQSVFPDVQRKGTTLIGTKPVEEAAPLYRPVQQAYQDMPEPAAVRTQAIDHITQSIDETGGEAAQLPTKMGLGPMYVVDSGAENVSKKSGFMLSSTKNANAARQLDGITPLMNEFPEMGTNPEQWAQGMSKAFGSKEVVAPPYRFMKAIQNGEYTDLLKTLTPGQIADADAGFKAGKEFLNAYHAGEMGVQDTGKLFMWGIMSRGVNPFTHEGLFLDAFNGIEPFIKMAAEGKFTKEVAEGPFKDWAATTAAKGSGQPGAGAMHNLNAFGEDFLVKMGRPGADGVTPMQKLHDFMSNPDMSGRDIRREFAKVGEGVGIDNKVVSFILLATGRDDVMVIDRIQLKNLWDDGRYSDMNIWDGISVPTVKMKDGTTKRFPPTDEGRMAQREFVAANPGSKGGNAAVTGSSLAEATYGAKGILVYEALEDALTKNVGKMYADLGRPEAASPGRFHWETWVARSNQEASHGTLPAILKKVQGSNNPLEGVYSKQGDYQSYAYGAKYGRSSEGIPQFSIPLSTGEDIIMSPEQYSAALDLIKKPSSGVIPNVKGQKFKVTDTVGAPWYEREGVNRSKLDDILRQAAAGQAGPVRKADGGSISSGSGSGAGGAGAGQTSQGGPVAPASGPQSFSLDQKVEATVQDIVNLAEDGDIDQRKLAFLLRKASTGTMPTDVSYMFAGEIMGNDTQALIERFDRYPRSIRALARVDLALGGLGGQALGTLANQKMRSDPASPIGKKGAGYAKGGKVSRKPHTGDKQAFEQFSDFAIQNYPLQVARNMVKRAGGDSAKLMFALNQYTKNLVAQDPQHAQLHQQHLQQLNQMARANQIDPKAAFNRTPDAMDTRKELQDILKGDHNLNPAFKMALQRMDRLVGS